jgi:DNA gyrase subunit B
MASQKQVSGYKAENITVLEGLEPVRKRPGMYIGGTGLDGLHHLIWEVLDNSMDEAMAGFCNDIKISLLPDNRVRVEDNGRGIPVDIHKQYKKSALELVLTKLHAGGKFDNHVYKVAGGLHGVGVSAVNALSNYLRAEVKRDGYLYMQEYERGVPTTKVRKVEKAQGTGTTILFEPDSTIFPEIIFDRERVLDHLRHQAYLTSGVRLSFSDLRGEAPYHYTFYFEGGLRSYVRFINTNNKPLQEDIFSMKREIEEVQVEMALQYVDEVKEVVYAFANNILNPEGGTHLAGFRAALTRTLNSFARSKEFLKEKDENFTGDDVREGCTAVISIKIRDPQFEGQTKAKLGNPEVKTIVETAFGENFATFLEEHPREAERIIGRCLLSAEARRAARQARETVLRKGALEGITLPGKLADCSSRNAAISELFIVEGDSAGGSSKQARNREFQAILPLKGKILNVERARIDKMLQNAEIKSIIIALGTNIGEDFDLAKLRYGKVVITTDADVDGAHIRTLLLTLFYRYFPALVREGHIYLAKPPLYRLTKGREAIYAFSDQERDATLASWRKENIEVKVDVQRYKGLGEMNPSELWETTMDPTARTLRKVTIEDVEKADSMFEVLMGEEVHPRKQFIYEFARSVKNLDI